MYLDINYQMIVQIITGILAFIPALVANPFAVVSGGGRPIDFGKKINDKRILGDGKTWKGLFGGGFSGGIIGFLLYIGASSWLELYPSFNQALIIPFTLSFGALIGDIGGSFFKRRMGKERGEETIGIDQYDFFLGSIFFCLLLNRNWFENTYFFGQGRITLIILLVGVHLLHRVVNIIGYKIGLKKEPW